MYDLIAMLLLSVIDAAFLILFIRWSQMQESKLNAILEEYKALKKSTELYILSAEDRQRFEEFDSYFEKVFKSLKESKEHVANRHSDG